MLKPKRVHLPSLNHFEFTLMHTSTVTNFKTTMPFFLTHPPLLHQATFPLLNVPNPPSLTFIYVSFSLFQSLLAFYKLSEITSQSTHPHSFAHLLSTSVPHFRKMHLIHQTLLHATNIFIHVNIQTQFERTGHARNPQALQFLVCVYIYI